MAQRYSRLESTEEKRNFRSATILLILSIAVVVLLFVYGIPLVGRVASFVSGLRGGNVITSNDKTPPIPPNYNVFPDYTNQQTISISGNAEPGVVIKLTFNGKAQETVVDKESNFSFQGLSLKDDQNKFSAVAVDVAGNISQPTGEKLITYDAKPPELTIDNPADGTRFFGNTERQINIQGTTETDVSITINNRIVSVNDSGKFQYPVTLNSGENSFTFKALDLAGNITEKTLVVNFSD